MKYKASFKYVVGEDGDIRKNTVPVYAFQVEGGANRNIRLKSTNDIGITSELEQARSYKNIRLYLSPTKDHKDMQAALDLTAAATKKLEILTILDIRKYSGGKFIEGLWLNDTRSSIKTEPYDRGRYGSGSANLSKTRERSPSRDHRCGPKPWSTSPAQDKSRFADHNRSRPSIGIRRCLKPTSRGAKKAHAVNDVCLFTKIDLFITPLLSVRVPWRLQRKR